MSENYLIIGDDEYMRETEETRLKDKFLSSDETELNYSVHSASDIDGIMDSLGTMPFLAKRRVVLIREAHDLPERSVETLLSYLENPLKTSVLVLSGASSFKSAKSYRKLSALTKVLKADKPDLETIRKWISSFFKNRSIEVSPAALDLIVELKGTDTGGIKTELEKLVSFSAGERIELSHVEQLVGRSVTETVFKLVDAINARDSKWAFRVLGDLYNQKKQPHEIIGYLAWYVRIMQSIALLSGKKVPLKKIAGELGYSTGYTRRLLDQSKKYPIEKVKRWISLLLDVDRDIKTGRRQGELALEMLLVSFLNG